MPRCVLAAANDAPAERPGDEGRGVLDDQGFGLTRMSASASRRDDVGHPGRPAEELEILDRESRSACRRMSIENPRAVPDKRQVVVLELPFVEARTAVTRRSEETHRCIDVHHGRPE